MTQAAKRAFYVISSFLIVSALILSFFVFRAYRQSRTPAAWQHAPEEQKLQGGQVPLHIPVKEPYLYALNPAHPEINAQGLRDDTVQIPKPAKTLRILLLGDSNPFGHRVSQSSAFPNRLEAMLRRRFKNTEVINAGVSGYSAYNELQYYLAKGRQFQPDIVIVAFCMNDVANPRLHWFNFTPEKLFDIPAAAVPNHAYDSSHAIPILKGEMQRTLPAVSVGFPTFISGEDTLGLTVLMDTSSPEWNWLTGIYDQLQEAVESDSARLMLLLAPLAYQLSDDYPYFPQKNLAEYCSARGIPCLDLLPAFKAYPPDSLFFLRNSPFYDVWHLTDFGHEATARELDRFFRENTRLLWNVFRKWESAEIL